MLEDANVCATIAVKDLDTAREFYEDTLGLSVDQEMPEAQLVIYRSGSSRLQIYVSSSAGSNKATYATWEVDDIEACVEALKSRDVVFEHYPDMPGVKLEGDIHDWDGDKAAWFRDPDGNVLCLHSRR